MLRRSSAYSFHEILSKSQLCSNFGCFSGYKRVIKLFCTKTTKNVLEKKNNADNYIATI